ncbi:MAG TPA: RHS repeat-associated core domain-containing protein [Chthoniobacter sp.]|nr:RHS repeat-associated core domain-containing protein [Chthoniobacter sp.]
MKLRALFSGSATRLRQWFSPVAALLLLVFCAFANAETIRYAYDDASRLTQVTAPDGKAARYTYDVAGRLVVTERDLSPKDGQPQTLVTYQRYDAADRVVSIAHLRRSGDWNFLVAGQAIARGPGGTIQSIDTFRSGVYDVPTGQFTGIPAVAQAFEYDGNARLTRERRTKNGFSIDTRYEYDAAGNRKTKTVTAPAGTETTQYSYDAADRLMEERTTLASGDVWIVYYGWDGNGNLAGKSEPGRVTLYRFDPLNRLIDIRVGASVASAQAAAPSISYAYDAQGNRVRKRAADERSYLIDPSYAFPQLAIETWSTGRSYYVRGLDVVRQTIEGGPLLIHLFTLSGHLGTSLGAVDASGEVVEQVDADAFGNLNQSVGLKQAHIYAGEYWDQDAQLLYLRARWYDPKVGRFISPDPLEGRQVDPPSLNRYAYAKSDPVHNLDPGGELTLGEQQTAQNLQTELRVAGQAAGKDFAAGAGRSVFNKLGELVETGTKKILETCFKDKLNPKNILKKGRKVNVDFGIQLKNRLVLLEAKYQMPKRGSEAMQRLIEQVKLAAASGREIVIFSGKELGKRATSNREQLLRKLAEAQDAPLKIISGFVGLAEWVAIEAIEECLK